MRTDRGRLHLLLEGQTEEVLAQSLLIPHLNSCGWQTNYSIIVTKRPVAGPAHRGGVSNWAVVERHLRRLLPCFDVVTTMIDYYAFPDDAPGMADRPAGDGRKRVAHVERAVAEAIGSQRFVSHLTLHEAEAWVFAAADELGALYGDAVLADALKRGAAEAGGPELVNDGPATAPSKRLLRLRPDYVKTMDGPLAVCDLGLEELRARCPHLDGWLSNLEAM